jgi:selenocysteine lyase/cysteine desulfurase
VIAETLKAWRSLEENPADEAFGPFLERMEQVRQKAAEFLGCAKEEIVLTRNTTEGMNTVAQGLNLRPGQRILTTDHEHPGGTAGWEYYARRQGAVIDRITLPLPPRNAGEILDRIEAGITPDTRVISVSHVTFSTGLQLPIREIAKVARERGCLLVVDGAQAPGVLNVHVKELGCHTYATSAHKWMLAPKGTGILYLSDEAGLEIDPLFLQHGRAVYTASTGTRNVPAILGLGAAMDFLNHLGKGRVQERALSLRGQIYEALSDFPQVRVVSPPPGGMASALVTFALPEGVDNGLLAQRLKDRHRVIVKVVPPQLVNGLRVSAHVYNSEEDVEQLLAALRKELDIIRKLPGLSF